MNNKPTIFVINGSASQNSTNQKLVEYLQKNTENEFYFQIFNDLKTLPHFDPERSSENPPKEIIAFRKSIENADGVMICTPEYIFSIPSGLKNALEWCVATTVFTQKPLGIITAAANGQKGHEELQLIMNTLLAKFTNETTLLISGIKGKISENGEIIDSQLKTELTNFTINFKKSL